LASEVNNIGMHDTYASWPQGVWS